MFEGLGFESWSYIDDVGSFYPHIFRFHLRIDRQIFPTWEDVKLMKQEFIEFCKEKGIIIAPENIQMPRAILKVEISIRELSVINFTNLYAAIKEFAESRGLGEAGWM